MYENMLDTIGFVTGCDPEVGVAMEGELARQRRNIELIASENIVSPAVLIAVAIAGVAGYTMPSQDMAAALRLWRFLLAILASLGGLFGLAMGCAALICHLAGLESFGVPYLAPFTSAAGQERGSPDLIRLPLPWMKWRNGAARSANRRNQR